MTSATDRLKANLEASIERKKLFLSQQEALAEFGRAVDLIIAAYKSGGRLYIAGNGGSAADAQHLAAELIGKLARPRNAIPAEALTTDSSTLTAIGNDYGFDEVFARQIQGKATSNDVFLGITTSGKSRNILRAFEEARKKGVKCIALTGHGGGPAKELSDVCISAPGDTPSDIQECHIVIYHTLCACVEDGLV
jgi:D-sedoheptulose 7-phosphate isomerase